MEALLKEDGVLLSKSTVYHYMKELGLRSIVRQKKKYKYVSGDKPFKIAENLLKQNFNVEKRNTKWCMDFTYVYFDHHKRYNCTVIDLHDRRVVASLSSRKINAQLAIDTVTEALKREHLKGGVQERPTTTHQRKDISTR